MPRPRGEYAPRLGWRGSGIVAARGALREGRGGRPRGDSSARSRMPGLSDERKAYGRDDPPETPPARSPRERRVGQATSEQGEAGGTLPRRPSDGQGGRMRQGVPGGDGGGRRGWEGSAWR